MSNDHDNCAYDTDDVGDDTGTNAADTNVSDTNTAPLPCGKPISHPWTNRLVKCGEYHSISTNGVLYCDDCLQRLMAQYPQGWSYYPGDTCRHGVYVGGVGYDYMCGKCEQGD